MVAGVQAVAHRGGLRRELTKSNEASDPRTLPELLERAQRPPARKIRSSSKGPSLRALPLQIRWISLPPSQSERQRARRAKMRSQRLPKR